jgi:hypothetical protein
MGGYLVACLVRDMADFNAYSRRYSRDYLSGFREKVRNCTTLVNPGEERAVLKAITARLYAQTDRLGELVSRLLLYFKMAKAEIPMTATDFGLTVLRNRIGRRDIEGILQNLRLVIGHVQKYGEALKKQGLTDAMIEEMNGIHAVLAEEHRKKSDIISNRKRIVQDNLHILNDLHTYIMEICGRGKILYTGKDAVKTQEYTFRDLVKKIRNT